MNIRNAWFYLRSALGMVLLNLTVPTVAQTISPPIVIVGNVATSNFSIQLPVAGTVFQAEFRLTFDQPQNFTAACLGLTATALEGAALAAVNARLPLADGVVIDPAFPVMVSVNPPADCNGGPGLRFRNEVRVEYYTVDLDYLPGSATRTPYRLYKAPSAGNFSNLTASTAAGSYRARGSTGGFSDFLIVKDLTEAAPNLNQDAKRHYDELQSDLKSDDLSSAAMELLKAELDVSLAAYRVGAYPEAILSLDRFTTHLRRYAGREIPNAWSAGSPVIDDCGEIISQIESLRFVLRRLNGESP